MLTYMGSDAPQPGRGRAPQQPGRTAGNAALGESLGPLPHYTENAQWQDPTAFPSMTSGAIAEGELSHKSNSSEAGNGLLACGAPLHLEDHGSPLQSNRSQANGAPVAFHLARPWPGRPMAHHPYRGMAPRPAYYPQYRHHPGALPYSSMMHPYAPPAPMMGRRQHPHSFGGHVAYSSTSMSGPLPPPTPGYELQPDLEASKRAAQVQQSPFLAVDAQVAALGPGGLTSDNNETVVGEPQRAQQSDAGIAAAAAANVHGGLPPPPNDGGCATPGGGPSAGGGQVPPPASARGLAPPPPHFSASPSPMYNVPYNVPYRPRPMMYGYQQPQPYGYPVEGDMAVPYGRRLGSTHSLPLPPAAYSGPQGYLATATAHPGAPTSAGGAPPDLYSDPVVAAAPPGETPVGAPGEPPQGHPPGHPYGNEPLMYDKDYGALRHSYSVPAMGFAKSHSLAPPLQQLPSGQRQHLHPQQQASPQVLPPSLGDGAAAAAVSGPSLPYGADPSLAQAHPGFHHPYGVPAPHPQSHSHAHSLHNPQPQPRALRDLSAAQHPETLRRTYSADPQRMRMLAAQQQLQQQQPPLQQQQQLPLSAQGADLSGPESSCAPSATAQAAAAAAIAVANAATAGTGGGLPAPPVDTELGLPMPDLSEHLGSPPPGEEDEGPEWLLGELQNDLLGDGYNLPQGVLPLPMAGTGVGPASGPENGTGVPMGMMVGPGAGGGMLPQPPGGGAAAGAGGEGGFMPAPQPCGGLAGGVGKVSTGGAQGGVLSGPEGGPGGPGVGLPHGYPPSSLLQGAPQESLQQSPRFPQHPQQQQQQLMHLGHHSHHPLPGMGYPHGQNVQDLRQAAQQLQHHLPQQQQCPPGMQPPHLQMESIPAPAMTRPTGGRRGLAPRTGTAPGGYNAPTPFMNQPGFSPDIDTDGRAHALIPHPPLSAAHSTTSPANAAALGGPMGRQSPATPPAPGPRRISSWGPGLPTPVNLYEYDLSTFGGGGAGAGGGPMDTEMCTAGSPQIVAFRAGPHQAWGPAGALQGQPPPPQQQLGALQESPSNMVYGDAGGAGGASGVGGSGGAGGGGGRKERSGRKSGGDRTYGEGAAAAETRVEDDDTAGDDTWEPEPRMYGSVTGGGSGRRRGGSADDGDYSEGEASHRRPRRKLSVKRLKQRKAAAAAVVAASVAATATVVPAVDDAVPPAAAVEGGGSGGEGGSSGDAEGGEGDGDGGGGTGGSGDGEAGTGGDGGEGTADVTAGSDDEMGTRPSLDQLLSQSVTEVADLDVLGDLEPQAVSALLAKVRRKGKGGRAPAEDPRLDPNIDPRKARRILANRISAARSKLKQKLILEGLKARYQQLLSSKTEYSRELADLRRACKELEARNRGLAGKLKDV